MPEVSSETQGKIIAYLVLDGYNQGAAGELGPTISEWLKGLTDDEGNQIFTLSRSRWMTKNAPLSGAAGAKNAYKVALLNGLSDFPEISKDVKYAYGAAIKSAQTDKKRGMGTKKDSDGDNTPKRNIKDTKFNYNGWAFKNIYLLAMGQTLSPDYTNRVTAVGLGNSKYLEQFDVETDTWVYSEANDAPTLEEVVEGLGSQPMPTTASLAPSEVFVPFTPTGASPGMRINNPLTQTDEKFPTITPPTAEEEIALSNREWNRQKKMQGKDPLYDFNGEVLVTFTPSPSDNAMQPITALISSAADTGAPQNADDFFGDDDWGSDDASDSASTSDIIEDSKWFLTPTIQFSFRRGADAYFRVLGDGETYAGQMWSVAIKDSSEPTRCEGVKLIWEEPVAGTPNKVIGFEIKLIQDGTEKVIKVKDNKITEGFQTNESDNDYNYVGGVIDSPGVETDTVVIYTHGAKGFGGLLNKEDNIEPNETLTWSDLNNSGRSGDYSGDVPISQASLIGPVIRTQISRFYGNPQITDMTSYWKNWTDSAGDQQILSPIKGGNNIIFNLSKEVIIDADIKLYDTTNPAYLQRKKLKLTIVGELEGVKDENWDIPEATAEVGVLSPNADGVWSSYIDFVCKGAKASTFFPLYDGNQRFILPGDEKYLEFITSFDEDKKPLTIRNQGRLADSIKYITYDISSAVERGENIVVPQVKIALLEKREDPDDDMEEIEEIKFLLIPDSESDFYAQDINGEQVGGLVEGGLTVPPDPQILIVNSTQISAYNKLEETRKAEKQSDSYTIRDEDNKIVTNSISWLMGEQMYYIVATNEDGESYMVKIDLRVQRRVE